MIVRDSLYIDGAWVSPSGPETLDVIDSTTEEVFATDPGRDPGRYRSSGPGGESGLPRLGGHVGQGPWGVPPEDGRGAPGPRRRDRRRDQPRGGDAAEPHRDVPGGAAHRGVRRQRRPGGVLRLARGDRQLARHQGARRCRGCHHAVELPPVPDRPQGRAGVGGGMHGGAEAERGRSDQRLHPGRDHPRGGTAEGRLQPRHRSRAGGRRGDRRAPARRQGLLHRLDPSGQAGHGALRADASSACRWRWAGSRRTSSWRTPTWRQRCRPACSAVT